MKQTKKILSLFFCLLFCLNLSFSNQKVKSDPATLGVVLGGTALGLGVLNTGLGLFNARTKVSKNDLNYRGNGHYAMPPGAGCCCSAPTPCCQSQTAFVQQRPMIVPQQMPMTMPMAMPVPVPMPVPMAAPPAFAAVPTAPVVRAQAPPMQMPIVRQQAFQPVRGLW